MAVNPRLPVIVGVAQTTRKPSGPVRDLPSPPQMIADCLELAAADSGAGRRLLERAESLQIPQVLCWAAPDPAAIVAGLLDIEPRERVTTTTGGNNPQTMVNQAATAIQAGDVEVVLIAGAEAMYSRRLAGLSGEDKGWPQQDINARPTRIVGSDTLGSSPFEMARSLTVPTQAYPVLECAVRADAARSVDEHQLLVSELWSRFSRVAASNPFAWSREPLSAAEIRTPTPENRVVAFPYPKLMNANLQVDQAAAVIVCSAGAAEAAGVRRDRWVFVRSGADANDHWFLSDRDSLARSPAAAACGRAVLRRAGIGIDDINYLDVYSCFPSAVQVVARELGLDPYDPARVLTVTGGLSFAGGPGNNYVTHSIATVVDRLRSDPGASGLVTGVGWYLTKHSMGVYSTEPPAAGFGWESPQAEVDALPRRDVATDGDLDRVVVEAYTVVHQRDGSPSLAIVAARVDDGSRTWANTTDPDLLEAFVTDDLVGRTGAIAAGQLRLG